MYDKTNDIIGAAIEVHRELGPGLLESVYESALMFELRQRGFIVERQVPINILYKGIHLEGNYFIDLLINKEIIVEIKAVEKNHHIHNIQLLTYLKIARLDLGLVVNFGMPTLKEGVFRIINNNLKLVHNN